jgi:mRNA interferase HicA
MKRIDLVRHLEKHGCRLLREGSDHSVWVNSASGARTAVQRHREIPNIHAKTICKQLGIPTP